MKRLLCLMLILSACAAGNVQPRLKGERVDVFAGEERGIEAVPRSERRLKIPKAVLNHAWSQKGQNARHEGGHLTFAPKPTLKWREDVGSGSDHYLISAPILAERTLLVIDDDHELIALDAQSGDELWSQDIDDPEDSPLSGAIAYDNGSVAVVTPSGYVSAHRLQDGEVLWTKNLRTPLRAAPATSDGILYVTTLSNQLLALSFADGSILWKYESLTSELGFLGASSPAIDDERRLVITSTSTGEVAALSSQSGQVFWRQNLPRANSRIVANIMEDVNADPIILEDKVIAMSYGGGLSAFDIKSGALLWQQPTIQSLHTPWEVGRALYVVTTDNQLLALDKKDGTLFWSATLPSFENEEKEEGALLWYGPIVAGKRAITVSSKGTVRLYHANKGDLRHEVRLNAADIALNPILVSGILYLLTQDAEVIALD